MVIHTFGHYGTVYWMYGILGVILVSVLLGALFGLGVRRFDRVWGVAVLAAVVTPAVWTEVSFPSYFVGLVQFWQICLALGLMAYLLERVLRIRPLQNTAQPLPARIRAGG